MRPKKKKNPEWDFPKMSPCSHLREMVESLLCIQLF